jgi:ABC-type polysaccharide/polyol phosphate export permease
MTPPVLAFRDPLFFGDAPAAGDLVYVIVEAVVALALGALVFRGVDDRIAAEA